MPAGPVFGPGSLWQLDVTNAPVSSESDVLVDNVASQVDSRYGGVAAFNVSQYNSSNYVVHSRVTRRDVVFDDCQQKGYEPSQLYSPDDGQHFENVPIPRGAQPAEGTDGELSVYAPDTDTLWELWKARRVGSNWHACWGGRIDDVSTSPGYFPDGMGVTATGLSVVGGQIGIREMEHGTIGHALSLNVVDAAHYTEFYYPAQRSDGDQPVRRPGAIREGQRFRLNPDLNLATLSLSPIARAVAEAAQKYGFIVNDTGGAVAVVVESGAGTAALTGTNPWDDLMGDVPSYDILANFPWGELQAIDPTFGAPS